MQDEDAAPRLVIRHSRPKVIKVLLAVQIFGAAAVYLIFYLKSGLFSEGQMPIAILGIVAGLAIYVPASIVGTYKLARPQYLRDSL